VVDATTRTSRLERLRRGPASVTAGGLLGALDRLNEIRSLGVSDLDLSAVPVGRVDLLARYAQAARAQALARLAEPRRTATLLAAACTLEADATDDLLDLLDRLLAALLARSQRTEQRDRLRGLPALDVAARSARRRRGPARPARRRPRRPARTVGRDRAARPHPRPVKRSRRGGRRAVPTTGVLGRAAAVPLQPRPPVPARAAGRAGVPARPRPGAVMQPLADRPLGRFARPRRRLRADLVQLLCALAGLGLGLLLPRITFDSTVASTQVTDAL
jgi:hypothetical protein